MYTKHDVLAISIHASREGSDRHDNDIDDNFTAISIHASRGGSDLYAGAAPGGAHISIHASREGSDWTAYTWCRNGRYFNPRFPRRKRLNSHEMKTQFIGFQSTLPAGEATCIGQLMILFLQFQSTLPVGEATNRLAIGVGHSDISIHASHGGSDENVGKETG